jgi:hypothetical protein
MGWELRKSILHRQEYRLPSGLTGSVYFDGGAPFRLEVDLEYFAETAELSELQYEDKVDEFYAKYQSVVREATQAIGKPAFDNGAAAEGFPVDQDAVWLALWPSADARYMIQLTHEDRELPFRIVIVVTPSEE